MIGHLITLLANVPLNAWTVTSIVFAIVTIVWRLWNFTIKPHLNPQDPVELPYWIPCE
jgi:hypothetical protein